MRVKWKNTPEKWEGRAVWIAIVIMVLAMVGTGIMVKQSLKKSNPEYWWKSY